MTSHRLITVVSRFDGDNFKGCHNDHHDDDDNDSNNDDDNDDESDDENDDDNDDDNGMNDEVLNECQRDRARRTFGESVPWNVVRRMYGVDTNGAV